VKVAVIHDWLVELGGAELVLKEILQCYPNADVFSLIDFLSEKDREFYIQGKEVTTSFLQKMPKAKTMYRNYLPLMPIAIEQLDLRGYDLVISSSYAAAKGVITGPNQVHVCYCHSPIRYAWDMQFQYLEESGLTRGLKSMFVKYILHKIRNWDVRTSFSVDHFISNSKFIGKRIHKVYKRDSTVIYPPVNLDDFTLCEEKHDFYLTASRMVPYKKIDLIVRAFNKMPDKKLVVIGTGPDFDKIKKQAGANVELMGYQAFEQLKEKMRQAKAFVFAAEEDFGIVPVEAQACGTPVIAFGKGGALETVINGTTGIYFDKQEEQSIVNAVNEFEKQEFDPKVIREHAESFSTPRFHKELMSYIESVMQS
jgi:glycosyltransferase involved in cell wall biosynthesis